MSKKPTPIGSAEFYNNFGSIGDRAHDGETFVVTSHGRNRYMICPLPPEQQEKDEVTRNG